MACIQSVFKTSTSDRQLKIMTLQINGLIFLVIKLGPLYKENGH